MSSWRLAAKIYLARQRWRNCRVGATHRPHTVCGGLHPPYKWLTSARARYSSVFLSGPSSTVEQGTHQKRWQRRVTFDCEPGELRETCTGAFGMVGWSCGVGLSAAPAWRFVSGMAIRSQAWPGNGGQEGSETSGVRPNNNPRHERPASWWCRVKPGSGLVPATGVRRCSSRRMR